MRPLVFLLLFSASSAAISAPLSTKEETNSLCSAAASKFAEGDTEAALAMLMPHWPLPSEEVKNLSYQTKSQLSMVATRFGAPIGSEHVRSTSAGQSFVQHLYLVKFANHALRLTCTFYKPKDHWVVNGVNWDDETQKLFE